MYVVAVITKIGSHPQRVTDHAFEDAVAFFSADGVTIAVRTSMSVIELQRKPGKEHGVSLSAHGYN